MSKITISYFIAFLLLVVGGLGSVIQFEDITRAKLKDEEYWNSYSSETTEFNETTELFIYTNSDDVTSVLYNDIDTLSFYSGVYVKEFSMFFFTEEGSFYPEFDYLSSDVYETYNDYRLIGKVTFQPGIYSYSVVHNQFQEEENVILTTSEAITYTTTNVNDNRIVFYLMAGLGFLVMSGTFIASSNRNDEDKLTQGYQKRERY